MMIMYVFFTQKIQKLTNVINTLRGLKQSPKYVKLKVQNTTIIPISNTPTSKDHFCLFHFSHHTWVFTFFCLVGYINLSPLFDENLSLLSTEILVRWRIQEDFQDYKTWLSHQTKMETTRDEEEVWSVLM